MVEVESMIIIYKGCLKPDFKLNKIGTCFWQQTSCPWVNIRDTYHQQHYSFITDMNQMTFKPDILENNFWEFCV